MLRIALLFLVAIAASAADPSPTLPPYMAELQKLKTERDAIAAEMRPLAERDKTKAAEMDAARTRAVAQFLLTADMSPVAVKIPENPSKDDLERAERLRKLNEWMESIVTSRRNAEWKPVRLDRDHGRAYADAHNAPWVLSLCSQ